MPKLTLPAAELGLRDIRVDGEVVGQAERLFTRREGKFVGEWHAELWNQPNQCPSCPRKARRPIVPCKTIPDLRAHLLDYLEEHGQWWEGNPSWSRREESQ